MTSLSNELSEETREYIKKETDDSEKENVKLWGENIQCNYIPYQRVKKPLAKLTSKPAVDSAFVTDFSMKYSTEKKDVGTTEKASKPVVGSKVQIDYFTFHF